MGAGLAAVVTLGAGTGVLPEGWGITRTGAEIRGTAQAVPLGAGALPGPVPTGAPAPGPSTPVPPAAPATAAASPTTTGTAPRTRAGCAPLRADPRIAAAAQAHSEDMAAAGYFAHDSLDGRTFADRIRAAGHPDPGAENIAQGQPDAAAVVEAWLASPGHRRNIEDCSLATIGVGLAGTARYWTQDFGR